MKEASWSNHENWMAWKMSSYAVEAKTRKSVMQKEAEGWNSNSNRHQLSNILKKFCPSAKNSGDPLISIGFPITYLTVKWKLLLLFDTSFYVTITFAYLSGAMHATYSLTCFNNVSAIFISQRCTVNSYLRVFVPIIHPLGITFMMIFISLIILVIHLKRYSLSASL